MALKCYNTSEALTAALSENEALRRNISLLSLSPRAQAAAARDAATSAALFSSDCQRTLRRTDAELQDALKEKRLLGDLLKKVQKDLEWAQGQQSKGCEAAISVRRAPSVDRALTPLSAPCPPRTDRALGLLASWRAAA